MPDDIRPYLQLGPQHKKGDWFLGPDFTVIRMYGTASAPYRLPKLLTPIIFVLEYIRQLVEIDEIHFISSRKKGRMTFPIVMGGYAIN